MNSTIASASQQLRKQAMGVSMGALQGRENRLLAGFDRLLAALTGAVKDHYGPRLVSVAVFGSVARRTPGPTSDVDVLLVAGRGGAIRRAHLP